MNKATTTSLLVIGLLIVAAVWVASDPFAAGATLLLLLFIETTRVYWVRRFTVVPGPSSSPSQNSRD
jgi:hypothetical protein